MSEAKQSARGAETLGRVGEYLGELFDEPFLDPETDHYYVGYGSTVLEVSVDPYGPEETIVEVTERQIFDTKDPGLVAEISDR